MKISFRIDGSEFTFETDFDAGQGLDPDDRAEARAEFATAVTQYLKDLAAKAIAARAQLGGTPGRPIAGT